MRNDSLSSSTNISTLSMEAQRDANRLTQEKINLERGALELAGKQARTQRIAAIAAVIAAIASIANFTFSIFITQPHSRVVITPEKTTPSTVAPVSSGKP